jgi:hypothetical protein
MLRTISSRFNLFRFMIVSVACAAGLVAQDSPQAPAPVPGNDVAVVPDQGAAQQGMAQQDVAQQGPAPQGSLQTDPAGPQLGPQGAPPDMGQGPQYPGSQRPPYYGPPAPPNGNYGYAPVPATLTLPSGSFVTVRVSQWLSSERNQVGDTFYATLVQPLIVDGVVVARKGSTVVGRVSEVKKSHSDSNSRLGLQLTSLSLVDGEQITVQSQVVDRSGTTTPGGQQAATIGATTAVGAGIGAVAGGGLGAAIGAGVGLAAGGIGVMTTRGRPTEVYPETMVTFKLDGPVAISTAQSAAAFHYATQEDYGMTQTRIAQGPPRPMGAGYAASPYGPAYGAYPYPYYPYPYYPYYYGPGVGVYIGPGFYGGFRGGFRR